MLGTVACAGCPTGILGRGLKSAPSLGTQQSAGVGVHQPAAGLTQRHWAWAGGGDRENQLTAGRRLKLEGVHGVRCPVLFIVL